MNEGLSFITKLQYLTNVVVLLAHKRLSLSCHEILLHCLFHQWPVSRASFSPHYQGRDTHRESSRLHLWQPLQ